MPAVESIRGGRFKYNLKSLFLNVSVQAAVQLEAQNIQVLSFNSTCFLSPQIVIDAFILNSFLLLINPPLFYSNIFVSVHLKLFSISAVRNFIVRYFSDCYPFPPTRCLDNPLSHQQRHHFWIHSTCLGVCLFRFPNI